MLETNEDLKCEQCDKSWGENGGIFIRRARIIFSGQISKQVYFYVQPDFMYEKEKALVFVDGGIHKKALHKADDEKKRKTIELAGFDVLVWDDTSEPVAAFVTRRQDIFRKVR